MSETSPLLVALPPLARRSLVEAKKSPNPENFVPVFDWDDDHIWVWLKKPGGFVLGPVDVKHPLIKKKYGGTAARTGKLGWVTQAVPVVGQIDPQAYDGPKDIYPLDWKPGTPLPKGPPPKSPVEVKYKPPKLPTAPAAAPALPADMQPAGTDPHGFPKGEVIGTGEIYSVFPPGAPWKFGDWSGGDGAYYPVFKDSSGEYDVDWDAPMVTPDEVTPKKAPEPPPPPPKPAPEPPPPPPPEAAPPAPVSPAMKDATVKAVAQGVEEPKPSTKAAKPSTEPEPEQDVIAPTPEAAPVHTEYTGEVDDNGLPLVEVSEGGGASQGWFTLLPDDRIARWSVGKYRVFAYHPAQGYVAASGVDVTKDEAQKLLDTLSLTVIKGRYYKVKKAGAAKAAPTTYVAPAPAHTKPISKKDPNGLPMVRTIPVDPDDPDAAESGDNLTLLPDGKVARWHQADEKYLRWKWKVDFGMGDFYPTHPKEYITLKQAQQQQAQVAAPPAAPKPTPAKPKVVPGQLKPTGAKDAHGFPLAKYKDYTYTQLPDGKVGVWNGQDGEYDLFYYSPTQDKYIFNAKETWTPPGKHSTAGGTVIGGVAMAKVKDTLGAKAVVLPNGKFAKMHKKGAVVLKVDVGQGHKFALTHETLTHDQIADIADEVPGYDTLEATGQVDVNGLPTYIVKKGQPGGKRFSMLPNGDFAVWRLSGKHKDHYAKYEYDPDDGWLHAQPNEFFALSDLKAMYMKAAAEPAAPPPKKGDPLVTVPGADDLELTGKFDANGLPKAISKTEVADPTFSVLPNGEVAIWHSDKNKYLRWDWEEEEGNEWWPSDPGVWYTVDDIKAMKPVKAPAAEPSPDPNALYLTPTGKTNKDGFLIYRSVNPKQLTHLVVSEKGVVYLHDSITGKYHTAYWQAPVPPEKLGHWQSVQPLIIKTADDIKGTPKSTPPALPKPVPLGKDDENGFPMFDAEGVPLSQLPNGEMGEWVPAAKTYIKYVQHMSDGQWWAASPPVHYALDDMLKLAGKTPAKVSGLIQLPVPSEGKESLEYTNKSDVNGYPLFQTRFTWKQDRQFTVLPDGTVALWLKGKKAYRKYQFVPWKSTWKSTPTLIKLSEIGAAPGKPAEPAAPEAVSVTPELVKPTTMPDPDTMQPVQMSLKGAGEKTVLEDAAGKRYLFKPAIPKSGAPKTQAFRAKSQEGFASVAAIGRPDAHVPVETVEYKGQLGTLQPMLDLDPDQPDLAGVRPEELTEQQKKDVAEEHLLDWLMSQHDSFAANFVLTKEGRAVGIDKEQGWKYVTHPQYPDRLATDYKPNTHLYGEQEPYYNKFWRAFAEGDMDFDPQSMSAALKRLETMAPEVLRTALQEYVATNKKMAGPEKEYERYAFEKKMMSRRSTLRRDFEEFITKQFRKRTGDEGNFTFATGWVTKAEEEEGPKSTFQEVTDTVKSLILKQLGSNSLKDHKSDPSLIVVRVQNMYPITKVKDVLREYGVKQVGEPKFGSNYNMVFVKRADLDKTVTKTIEIKPEPGEKFKNYSGAPTYQAEALAPDEAPPNIEEFFAIDEETPLGYVGKQFTLDGRAVEGQSANVQRVILPGGQKAHVVHFKLRKPYWEKVKTAGKVGTYRWHLGAYNESDDAVKYSSSGGGHTEPARVFTTPGGSTMYVLTSAKWAFRGSVYMVIPEGKSVKSESKHLLDLLGLSKEILRKPTPADTERYHLMQALWSSAPRVHDKLVQNTPDDEITVELLKKKLKGKLTQKEIASIRSVQGPLGKSSLIIPGRWKRLGGGTEDNPVVNFPFWQVSNPQKVAIILKTGGVGAHERMRMGLGTGGSSVASDMDTGGSDNVTTRIAMRDHGGSMDQGNVQGDIKLIIAPELLDRLDVHLVQGDSYGSTKPGSTYFSSRKSLSGAVSAENKTKHTNTELVVRRGFPASMIKRVATSNEAKRKKVLEALDDAGITEHNGVPIEDFVVVETSRKAMYEKYLKPLGY